MPTSKIYTELKKHNPMKMWTTEIWAYSPAQLFAPWAADPVKWQGPHVPGRNIEEAQEYCNKNGMGYCRVYGELIEEGPCDTILDNNN